MGERGHPKGLSEETVTELARRAWETNSTRMISWHEVGDMARSVLSAAVRFGAKAVCESQGVETGAPTAPSALLAMEPKKDGRRLGWDGPLFYPPVGKIAVMGGGDRVEVWPDESCHQGCFTGLLLKGGRSIEERRVHDLSCMWDRKAVSHIEEPSEADKLLLVHATPTGEASDV